MNLNPLPYLFHSQKPLQIQDSKPKGYIGRQAPLIFFLKASRNVSRETISLSHRNVRRKEMYEISNLWNNSQSKVH